MSDSNQTDQTMPNSRRERGKLAQREYRKRHASKFHGLQEENKRLREAIANISDAVAARGRPWVELESALSQARDAAGLEPLEFGTSSSAPTATTTTTFINMTPNLNNTSHTTSSETSTTSMYSSSPIVAEPEPRSQPLGTASAALRHGTSDPVRLVQPNSPNPYLEDGLTSLAGLISWACTSYTVTLWRTIHRGGATTQLEDFVDEHMLGTLRLMTDQAYLASLSRARLTDRPAKGCVFRRLGSLADVETLRDRYRKLTSGTPGSDQLKQLGKTEMWRSPHDVEEHLRRQATPEEFDRVQAVVQGRAGDYDVLCVGRYVVSLCGNFVCSSDGPRWHAMYMTMATGLMLRRLRGEAVSDVLGPS